MQLERRFNISRSRDDAVEILCSDDTLLALFPGDTEIIAIDGDRRTTRTRYRALGQEGEATFDFTYLIDGTVVFSKVCDGRVWRDLEGSVSVEEDGAGAVVTIDMTGHTKRMIPELTIKGPMEEQISQMARALLETIEAAPGGEAGG